MECSVRKFWESVTHTISMLNLPPVVTEGLYRNKQSDYFEHMHRGQVLPPET